MPNGWRPAALATTGSKSTNQDRKMARARDSSPVHAPIEFDLVIEGTKDLNDSPLLS
jgi:hypothetical protein